MEQKQTEKFKTMIGGQALIEGIMMRGPEKDAVVVRRSDGSLDVETTPRNLPPEGSPKKLPLIRGVVNFFDAQIVGVKALMRSAELAPEDADDNGQPSKFDLWLEKKLGEDGYQKVMVPLAVAFAMVMMIGLFFLLPMVIGGLFDGFVKSTFALNLIEGLVRILIFLVYMAAISGMKEMRRVFSYHGAEHKTIRCYEAGLPLTVENVRAQTRLHPRCGTSFLLVVLVLSILIFSVASTVLLALIPPLAAMRGTLLYRLIMILFKLMLIPLTVSVSYEVNRWVGRHDNRLTRILTAPGMWFQHFTTREPDDGMMEVGIAALEAVLPEKAGTDRW